MLVGGFFERPILTLFYHQACPHFDLITTAFKRFAEFAKTKKAVLNIEAINYGKNNNGGGDEEGGLGIRTLPELRLYVGPGNYKKYEGSEKNFDGLINFIG